MPLLLHGLNEYFDNENIETQQDIETNAAYVSTKEIIETEKHSIPADIPLNNTSIAHHEAIMDDS